MKNYKILFNFLTLFLLLSGSAFAVAKKPANKIKPKNNSVKKTAPAVQQKATIPKEKEIIKNIIPNCSAQATLADIVKNPDNWLNKEICFNGIFSSFSGLALDYPPAMRERKKYISLVLLRPNTQIPLAELKLAMKIEEAQKHELLPKIAEGDSVKIKGKVFSTALGEPWVDILQIQVIKDPNSKNNNSTNAFDEL